MRGPRRIAFDFAHGHWGPDNGGVAAGAVAAGDRKGAATAVAELRGRLDLREDIALMGEDIRTAIDDQVMKTWGEQPPVHFFPGARWVALALACAAVLTFGLFLAQVLSLRPLLAGCWRS